jgi:hypothetical protein
MHWFSAIDLFEDRAMGGRLFTEVQKCWQSRPVARSGTGAATDRPARCGFHGWCCGRGRGDQQSIGFFRDLPQRAAQQRIEELAYSDTLDRVAHRLLLPVDRVLQQRERCAAAVRDPAYRPDRFKNINDLLGHQFGDRC